MPELDTPITTSEQLQEHLDKAANAARRDQEERMKRKFADYDDLVTFKADSEQALTDATTKIDDLTKELEEERSEKVRLQTDRLRHQVANEKQVPAHWVLGDTQEEMEASADKWLADIRERTKPGVVPGQGTGDPSMDVSTYETGRDRARARYGRS